jgi:hypothetical protein
MLIIIKKILNEECMGIDCDNEEESIIDTIDGKLLRGLIAMILYNIYIYIYYDTIIVLIFNHYIESTRDKIENNFQRRIMREPKQVTQVTKSIMFRV